MVTCSSRDWLMTLLKTLELYCPPPTGMHHSISFARYGSDETGWEDKLAVHVLDKMAIRKTLFFDEVDFLKTADFLALEIADIAQGKLPVVVIPEQREFP